MDKNDPAFVELLTPNQLWCRDVALVREVGVDAALAMHREFDMGWERRQKELSKRFRDAGYGDIFWPTYAAAA